MPLPELLNCSHPFSQEHAHDCHKDEVRSFEEYCEIVAKMKISYDLTMKILSSMLSNVDCPPLIGNNVAHDVKVLFCRVPLIGNRNAHHVKADVC